MDVESTSNSTRSSLEASKYATSREQDVHPTSIGVIDYEENILSLRRHATDPDTLYSGLRKDLEKIRKEYPRESSEFFYPIDGLRKYIIPGRITSEIERSRIEDTNDNFEIDADQIHKKAQRLFGILVMINLAQHIVEMMADGIGDSDLPFRRYEEGVKLCRSKGSMKPIKCMENWTEESIHSFNRIQHSFVSPVFHFGEEIHHQELHDNCRLPFLDLRGGTRHDASEGGCSSVSKIKIHPLHQTLAGQDDPNVSFEHVQGS